MIEYALIIGGVALAIISAVFSVGEVLENLYERIGEALDQTARCVEVDSNCKK